MRIETLRIENFRRFARVDLELPDGVLALVGRNGAGKSTLLEAIGWCLYGNDAARTSKDLIKRRGCAPDDPVRVSIAFRHGAHGYQVTRELLGKGESHVASVVVDGKVAVPAGPASGKETTAYVERLFHMDRVAFFTSLVARQRELSALTDAKPAERKRILIGLLRLDAVDDAIRLARERKRDARGELAGLKGAMRDVAPLEAQRQVLRAQLAADEEALRAAESAIVALVDQVEEARARRDSSRKRADDHRAATVRILTAASQVASLAKQREQRALELARARNAGEQAAKLAEELVALPGVKTRCEAFVALRIRHEESARVQAELQKAVGELARAQRDLATATAALMGAADVRARTALLPDERRALEAALSEAERVGTEMSVRRQEAARLLREVEQKADRVRAMGPETPCPTCTRPLREHHDKLVHGFAEEAAAHRAVVADLQPQADAARAKAARLRTDLLQLSGREAEAQVKLNALAREEERAAAAKRLADEAGARAERLRAQAAALEAEPYDAKAHQAALADLRRLEGLQQQHARLCAEADRADECARLVGELTEAESAARAAEAEAKAARDALGFDPAQHDALEKAAEATQARLDEARLRRERAVHERALRLAEDQRLADECARQADLAARAKTLEAKIVVLEHLAGDRDVGLLPEFKDHLVARVRPLLTAHAGRLFRELTEGRYADLEVAQDYDLKVHDDGAAFELARFSGGECDLANLCLRLAVSQVVAERAGSEGFGFLALDEVFGSQDEVRKGNILRALKALSGRFRQIVLITHVDDVKEAAECVLRVRALDDGTSTVTVEST